MKKKVLFLIHDLGGGGAEKVLVNLVNHMDHQRYEVHVTALFGGGIHEKDLAQAIHYHTVWQKTIPGNSKLMMLLTPRQLHKLCVKEHYDIEIAYLEGPSARVISGCPNDDTELICWIHGTIRTKKHACGSFRSFREAEKCYSRFNYISCVSDDLRKAFVRFYPDLADRTIVRYNTNETDKIKQLATELIVGNVPKRDEINLIAVGKICQLKGFDRLARIVKRLREDGLPVHLYALGVGPDREEIEGFLNENNMQDYYTFLGYQTNPYKYVANCDLFVCASHSEGFSTAATEALIVGTPVCTVEVSGMKEMLGENNEWGVVTENDDEALYQGIRRLVVDPGLLAHYRQKACERGKTFSTENTVRAVEELLEGGKRG